MCAIEAGKRGRRVLLLEHNETVGKKIRISGGGRCNFTNMHTTPENFLSDNPRFATSALARYTPGDFIAFVERHGIAYHEKKLGQLFCDGSAQLIIDALLRECADAHVEIRTGCIVDEVQKPDNFSVATSHGTFRANALVVATGGLSIPKLGATDFGYRLARQFGLNIVPCAPGLVPFTLQPIDHQQLSDLPGISFDAMVSCNDIEFEESVLITHRGLSGPAILQIASYWDSGLDIVLDLFPGVALEDSLMRTKRDSPATLPRTFLATRFSARFAQRLCEIHAWSRPFGEMPDTEVRAMANALQQWRITPAGTEGYAKAEVTRGGIDTKALSPKTMETRGVPGLYFIGEAVDVTGWLGGYNFQWAWASGFSAGNAI